VGIPKQDLDKLFKPFFTTKAKGQGLGLTVYKPLAEAHDGSISVEKRLLRRLHHKTKLRCSEKGLQN